MYAFRFENRETGEPGYWKDVGTLDSYYEASMEWLESESNPRHFRGAGSVIADGVRIHPTAEVVDSVVLPGVEIGPGARIRRAILDERVRVLRNARIGDDCAGNGTFTRTAKGIIVVPANTTVSAESNGAPVSNCCYEQTALLE